MVGKTTAALHKSWPQLTNNAIMFACVLREPQGAIVVCMAQTCAACNLQVPRAKGMVMQTCRIDVAPATSLRSSCSAVTSSLGWRSTPTRGVPSSLLQKHSSHGPRNSAKTC